MEVYLITERSLGPNPSIQVCERKSGGLQNKKETQCLKISNAWQLARLGAVGELIREGMRSKVYNGNDIFLERSLLRRFSLNQSHVEGDKFGRLF